MTKNKENFNKCTSLVFDLLYLKFPQETNVVIDDLVDIVDEEMNDDYFATIRFWQREGLFSYQEFYFGNFNGVVLTAKGLKILDTVLVNKEETIAQQISHTLQEQDNVEISKTVQEIIELSTYFPAYQMSSKQ